MTSRHKENRSLSEKPVVSSLDKHHYNNLKIFIRQQIVRKIESFKESRIVIRRSNQLFVTGI